MPLVALKMLLRDRSKFIGILIGIIFASLLITEQAAIYTGLMERTYGFIIDTGGPDIWVMDENIDHVDDATSMADKELLRVRGVEGVDWAVPLFKGIVQATLPGGGRKGLSLVGLDDATLEGGPPRIVEGSLDDLRQADAIIIDRVEGNRKLLKPGANGPVPIEVGDEIQIRDQRAVVVGFSESRQTFQSEPLAYTTYSRAVRWAPPQRKMMTYILANVNEGEDPAQVAARISELQGIKAYTKEQFVDATYNYWFEQTGIAINFGTAVLLGFLAGTAIAGQLFYNFTMSNLRFFGTFKAMGASNLAILGMILLQALVVGAIGYGLGVGGASSIGWWLTRGGLVFKLEWNLLAFTGIAVLFICLFSSVLSMQKIVKLEAAVVFRE